MTENAKDALRDALLASDPDYWLCPDCGKVNSRQTNGEDCPWCHGEAV